MVGNCIGQIRRMFCNNRLVISMMIMLVGISFFVTGQTFVTKEKTDESADDYTKKYVDSQVYWTAENLSDNNYYRYTKAENSEYYNRLQKFKASLFQQEEFCYMCITDQMIQIINKRIPDIFLSGYEEGDIEYDINKVGNQTLYSAKAIEVSANFFDYYNIKVENGKKFSDEDYIYKEGKNIPILLGNEYKKYFEIGDTFNAYFLCDSFCFEVIGFIKPQSFFYVRGVDDFLSCERYIILPALDVNKRNSFSQSLLLQQMEGMVVSSVDYKKTNSIYKRLLKDADLENWELSLIDPNAKRTISTMEAYAGMTNQVAYQFKNILILILAFTCVAVIFNVLGILKKNSYSFGVELLCGASYHIIFMESIGLVSSIIFIGDFLASIGLIIVDANTEALLLLQIIALFVILISCIASYLYLKQMNIEDIIGGKE